MIELVFLGIFLLIIYACRGIIYSFFSLIIDIVLFAFALAYKTAAMLMGLSLIGLAIFALVDTFIKNPQTIANFIAQIPGALWLMLVIVGIWLFFSIKSRFSGTPSQRFARDLREKEQEKREQRIRDRQREKARERISHLEGKGEFIDSHEDAELSELKRSLWR